MLASVAPRRHWVERRARGLRRASDPVVLDCGGGVRLSGYYARGTGRETLVLLLHGWEGDADSAYVLSAASHLHELGYPVFRLNLRDHGGSFHLNAGIFHSCRLAEVAGAVAAVRERYRPARLAFVGFSLGGNFALRVAAQAGGVELDQVIAVSPVLDPSRTMRALDEGPGVYRRYFLRRWRRSLARKAAQWPELYDFAALDRYRYLGPMTAELVAGYTEFPTLAEYLEGYAITGDRLSSLRAPSSILAALDDPIIPAEDLARLAPSPALRVWITESGGHCGFLETLAGPSYADRCVETLLAHGPEAAAPGSGLVR